MATIIFKQPAKQPQVWPAILRPEFNEYAANYDIKTPSAGDPTI